MLTLAFGCVYNGGKASNLITSGLSAPKDLRLFLYPMNVGGAENKRGFVRIISRVLYHVTSPRRLTGSGLLVKGYKKMQELISYTFKNNSVRTLVKDNAPWFVATEVAKALEYREAGKATRLLDDDEKDTHIVGTLGGKQELTIINESGLYSLILRSRKPEAKAFKKFVTSEVLPSIRKTGTYVTPAQQELGLVPVSSYTRRLPSGPREIKLSDKARSEIGGIVKACLKDITVTQTVDPIGYNIPESLKQPDVVPAEVEKELWRLTEQLHYGLQKQQPNTQNTSVLNLFYLLRAGT